MARSRTSDVGVRIAFGGTSRQILVSVLRDGLLLTVIGLAIGFGASVAVLRTFGSLLYGVSPADVSTYAAVVVMLSAISRAACYLPAKRAAVADPIDVLRRE
jgi:putative ABC transport system permease protein